jgi:hypothetical protein
MILNKIIDILNINKNIRTIRDLIYDYIYNKIDIKKEKYKSGYNIIE